MQLVRLRRALASAGTLTNLHNFRSSGLDGFKSGSHRFECNVEFFPRFCVLKGLIAQPADSEKQARKKWRACPFIAAAFHDPLWSLVGFDLKV